MSTLQIFQVTQTQVVRYVSLALLISGSMGNILNCFIFTRRALRKNPCSVYFFITSIANLVALYFGCLTRLLITYGILISSSQALLYCRARTFFTYMPISVSTWLVVTACADRYASSSLNIRIRSFSHIKVSLKVLCVVIFVQSLIWCQLFVCLNLQSDGLNCFPTTPFCVHFNNYSVLIFSSLLPTLFMFLLGWLTIRNVHHRPMHRRTNSKDRQLTCMLIIQVFCFAILSLPISAQRIYAELTLNEVKTQQRIQIENFLATAVLFVTLINTSIPFYVFTLTSRLFRSQLKPFIFFWRRRRRQARIEPTFIVNRRVDVNGTTLL